MNRVVNEIFSLLLAGCLAAAASSAASGSGQIDSASERRFETDYSYATFDSIADFRHAAFDTAADFARTAFGGHADFFAARFNSDAYFWRALFAGSASFRRALFDNAAHFVGCTFNNSTDFGQATFRSTADFRGATFSGYADFGQATFYGAVDFRGATFATVAHFADAVFQDDHADFTFAVMQDELIIGSTMRPVQTYNFKDAIFRTKARIVILDQVKLQIPLAKMKFVKLADHLDYYTKKHLIEFIKDASFTASDGRKFTRERLELDYIYARSTMFQDKVFGESENRLSQIWKWPRWGGNLIYYLTMGLGYRPFWLIFWLLGVILFYSIVYALTMPGDVEKYICHRAADEERQNALVDTLAGRVGTFVICLHFSASILLTCRLKDLHSYFSEGQKMVIFSERFLGLLLFVSFITLSKHGAILQALGFFVA
ncbi:pentapeptide repeat-containing protein [candidate division KSB1 bacterium]|nr:pentapeptide repeat-containing protein [candidate division KSB1 bacterium]